MDHIRVSILSQLNHDLLTVSCCISYCGFCACCGSYCTASSALVLRDLLKKSHDNAAMTATAAKTPITTPAIAPDDKVSLVSFPIAALGDAEGWVVGKLFIKLVLDVIELVVVGRGSVE